MFSPEKYIQWEGEELLLIFHRSFYVNVLSISIPFLTFLAMKLLNTYIFAGAATLRESCLLSCLEFEDRCGSWSGKRTKWWSEKGGERSTKKAEAWRLHCVTPIWDINGKGKRLLISCFWWTLALHFIPPAQLGKGHSALFLTMTTFFFAEQCIIGLCLALICIIKEAWCSR